MIPEKDDHEIFTLFVLAHEVYGLGGRPALADWINQAEDSNDRFWRKNAAFMYMYGQEYNECKR